MVSLSLDHSVRHDIGHCASFAGEELPQIVANNGIGLIEVDVIVPPVRRDDFSSRHSG